MKQKSSVKVAVGGSRDEFSAAVSPRCALYKSVDLTSITAALNVAATLQETSSTE